MLSSKGNKNAEKNYRETHCERGHILGSYLTCILHTARISNIIVVLCDERMKDGRF